MGYSNGFIASVILKNTPLREFNYRGKRTVKVPFGSEYIIRLKNKTRDPALVEVSIDGTDVLNGSQIVLKAGETMDLERFVDDNSKGKKFKYISLEAGAASGEIDDPFREENGLVRIKFHKALHIPKPTVTLTSPMSYPFCGAVINHDYYVKGGPSVLRNNVTYSSNILGAAVNTAVDSSRSISSNSLGSLFEGVATASCGMSEELPQDKGATVEGSESKQSFSTTSEYYKLGLATTVDIYLVGPEYKEEVLEIEWGVFVGSTKEPIATFKDKKHAHLFAGNADFGKEQVTIKENV